MIFVTPAAITKSNGNGGRFSSLFPEPVDIFRGLNRRWQSLEGPELPDDLEKFVQAGGCVVSNYSLRAIEFQTPERTQIGFLGWVVYECRRDEGQIRICTQRSHSSRIIHRHRLSDRTWHGRREDETRKLRRNNGVVCS